MGKEDEDLGPGSLCLQNVQTKRSASKDSMFYWKAKIPEIIIKLNRIDNMTDSTNIYAVILNEKNEYISSWKLIAK